MLLLGFVPARGQTLTAGARSASIGFAETALSGEPSFAANAAAPAMLDGPIFSVSTRRPFGLAELQTAQFLYAGPLGRTHTTLGMHTFGFAAYRELQVRAGAAHRIRPWFDLGLHVQVYTVRISSYGSAQTWGLTLGGLLRPTPTLHFGFQAVNMNRPAWAGTEALPRRLAVGLMYQPTLHTRLLLDVDKAVQFPASIRGGLEFEPVPTLALRVGFSTAPHRFTAGFGLQLVGIRVDAAAVRHPYLGWTPVLSLRTHT